MEGFSMKFLAVTLLIVLLIWGCNQPAQPFDSMKISLSEIAKPQKKTEKRLAQAPAKNNNSQPSPTEKKPQTITPADKVAQKPKNTPPAAVAKPAPQPPKPTLATATLVEKLPDEIADALKLKPGNYRLQQKIKITESGTLFILPGTEIDFVQCGIVCHGRIIAEGDPKKKIVFKGPAGWDNITVIGTTAQGQFKYCDFSGGVGMEAIIGPERRLQFRIGSPCMGGALLYANGAGGEVSHCLFRKNFAKGALAIISAGKVKVEHCEFVENEEETIICFDGEYQIQQNKIFNNQKSGIVCMGSSRASIQKNTIMACRYAGIFLLNDSRPIITDNKLVRNIRGVEYRQRSAGILKNNIFTGNLLAALRCLDKSRPTVENNQFVSNGAPKVQQSSGIDYAMESSGILRNNVIKNNVIMGVRCYHKSQPIIEGNTLVNNGAANIFIGQTASPKILGNQLQQAQYSIIIIEQARPVIEKNTISDVKTGIVIDKNASPVLRDNQFKNCQIPRGKVPETPASGRKPR